VADRVFALIRKEFIHLLRDPRLLGFAFVVPVVNLMLFGYAINLTVDHVSTVVLDQANDQPSRDFVQALVNSSIFVLTRRATSPSDVRASIDQGNARIGIIIPPDFARLLERGQDAPVQVLVDGSDPVTAQATLYAMVALGENQSSQSLAGRLAHLGVGQAASIDLRPFVLYNPSMASVNFMLPGLIGMILQLETVILISASIVDERENGTLEQLIVLPYRPVEIMLGKITPYVAIAFGNLLLVVATSAAWFHVRFAGSLLLLLALSTVFLFSALGMGLLVSTVSETRGQATQLAIFLMIPAMLLTGFVFPRETMPLPLHDLGYLFPMTYFLEILRGIMLKGVGLDVLWNSVWPMALLAAALFGLSVARFRRQLG
jgi:ABC-2 type transport system permease protein